MLKTMSLVSHKRLVCLITSSYGIRGFIGSTDSVIMGHDNSLSGLLLRVSGCSIR